MKKALSALGLTAVLLLAGKPSYAITVFVDEFTITRDGVTVLNDAFSDNVPPPSGPAGAATYFISQGTIPAGSESGGLLALNTDNGSPSANAIESPRLSVVVTRLTSITGGANQLGPTNLLSETGLFNLLNTARAAVLGLRYPIQ